MTTTTKRELLAQAPAAKRAQILAILKNARLLLQIGHGRMAAQQLAYARQVMATVCNTAIPKAIRHSVKVAIVSIVGTGKYKRYSAYTEAAGIVTAATAKAWLEYYNLRAAAKQERVA